MNYLAGQKINRLSWIGSFYYRVHESPPLEQILSRLVSW
jgi:hypothetical protein